MMFISPDGLVHLSMEELLSVPMQHLISGIDEDDEPPVKRCGTVVSISGYTEWVSSTQPEVSIGWDWHLQATRLGLQWVRIGLPRTNVMIQSKAPKHLDWQVNLVVLATVVDALPWQQQVIASLEHSPG